MRFSKSASALFTGLIAVMLVHINAVYAEATDQVRLTELIVNPTFTPGVRYDVGLRFEITGNPKMERVCFYWSGEGPYCWESFYVDNAAGIIRTRARTRNAGSYTLTGVVQYRSGTEGKLSNEVSAPIHSR